MKNNLQLISSLLYLQSTQVNDPKILAVLRESQALVRSVAFIHEQLCASKELGRIDFAAYLRKLISDLLIAYHFPQDMVDIAVHADATFLDLDTALPCGLIVNELVSNALKHAFPGGKSGRISMSFEPGQNANSVLRVSDDGIGLPSGFAMDKVQTMGVRLVDDLTRQLGGTAEFKGDHGTSATITFPKPVPEECDPAGG